MREQKGRATIEETFEAPTPEEAFLLAKKKYGSFDLKLLKAKQIIDKSGNLVSQITVEVPSLKFFAQMKEDDDTLEHKISLITNLLTNKGLSREWIESEISKIKDREVLADERALLTQLISSIDKNIETKEESLEQKKVVMLIGTTGVGKTTTVAKLAARYAYMLEKEYKVAILNLDSFRAGAYEQLKVFANTLLLDYFLVSDSNEFLSVMERLDSYDVILVDTAGISPRDTDRLIKSIKFLKSIKNRVLEVELVVSASFKYEDIQEIYDYFSFLNLSSLIITKLDETNSIGNLITFLMKSKIPVSYLSFGQRVPDDILVASKSEILDYFVGDKFDA